MELSNAISAVLFYLAEPVSIKRLSVLLKRGEGEIRDTLSPLRDTLGTVGLCLLQNGDEVTLGTAPDASGLIQAITKEELSRDLSKAGLETLAIVLYQGPITRSEIDYIRGVNSTFILRNLLVRGLVEKVENPNDSRSFLYKPTFQLLEYMGVGKLDELPAYHDAIAELGKFAEGKHLDEEKIEAPVPTPEHVAVAPDDAMVDSGNAEETKETAQAVLAEMEQDQLMEDLEADVMEEDEAGPGFDDAELRSHTEEARIQEEKLQ